MKKQDGPLEAKRKQELRAELASRHAQLTSKDIQTAPVRVAERALEIPEVEQAHGILTCLSFGHEIDTWGLVRRLLDLGRAVYVPRTEPRDHRLHVHRYPCELRSLSFGLQEPVRGTPELDESAIDDVIDVVLILGLGFDRRGYRLGHGAGYFDRFLAGRPFPRIGLAYHAQLLDELPVEGHDVPMTAVITERGVWRPDPARETGSEASHSA